MGIIEDLEKQVVETAKRINKNDYETRWEKLKQKAIDYRFNKTGSHEDGRYCVAISVTDLLKWMEELEGEDGKD